MTTPTQAQREAFEKAIKSVQAFPDLEKRSADGEYFDESVRVNWRLFLSGMEFAQANSNGEQEYSEIEFRIIKLTKARLSFHELIELLSMLRKLRRHGQEKHFLFVPTADQLEALQRLTDDAERLGLYDEQRTP